MTCVGIAIIAFVLGGVSIAAGVFASIQFGKHMAELDAAIARHNATAYASKAANDGSAQQ